MKLKTKVIVCAMAALALSLASYQLVTRTSIGSHQAAGTQIDELNGVAIFYNGGVNQSHGRNLSPDGYNIGLKYQCVEFVKRYYLERLGHQMPDAFGHARSFFDPALGDGALNEKRGLLQFRNGSVTAPAPDDIVVFGPSLFNPYGHVAIIADVNPYAIVIAQQNAGPVHSSRESIPLIRQPGGYRVDNDRVLGWLRLPIPSLSPEAQVAADSGK